MDRKGFHFFTKKESFFFRAGIPHLLDCVRPHNKPLLFYLVLVIDAKAGVEWLLVLPLFDAHGLFLMVFIIWGKKANVVVVFALLLYFY